jgi:NAD(P)-dependent dehydrogenase (short-subunit alcohol dehydrogenase family)
MRSIAGQFYQSSGIRVNAICPSTVRTGLLDSAAWDAFGKENVFVPIEKVVSVILMLIDGHDVGGKKLDDSGKPIANGVNGSANEKLNGVAVELSGTDHYYRDQIGFCDDSMAKTMGGLLDRSNF